MKRFIWFLGVLVLAAPVFAQDFGDGGGFGGDTGGFGGDSSFSADAGDDSFATDTVGGFAASAPKVDALVDVRRWLALSGATALDKKQEKALNKLYDKEVKAMAKAFEAKYGISLSSAIAADRRSPRSRPAGFGRTSPERTAEVTRLSEELVDKIIAALRIDQQSSLRKYQSEQQRLSRMKRLDKRMELAGVTLTSEQKAQVDSIFARESRLRTLLIVEAKGEASKHKVAQLEAQTNQRLMGLLDQNQKNALAASVAKTNAVAAATNPTNGPARVPRQP